MRIITVSSRNRISCRASAICMRMCSCAFFSVPLPE